MDFKEILKRLDSVEPKRDYLSNRDEPLAEYSGLTAAELEHILDVMLKSRRILIEEKNLTRRGECYFFIGSAGKELVDAVAAHLLRPDDPFFGYYRNKTFDIYRGISSRQKLLEAIGDPRSSSTAGMLQHAHSAYREESIMPQASPTGSHALEAAAVGGAIANPTPISEKSPYPDGRWPKDAITYCAIGEGSTSEAEFARAVFYAAFGKTKNIFAIYNCGWAISVSVDEQFPDGDPTTPFEGFQRFGLKIDHIDGSDIKQVLSHLTENIEYCRTGKGPVLIDVNVVRDESHSGSDDQSHYMSTEEQLRHHERDPIFLSAVSLIEDGVITTDTVRKIWDNYDQTISRESAQVVADRQLKTKEHVLGLVTSYDFEKARQRWQSLLESATGDRKAAYAGFHKDGIRTTAELPENQAEMTLRQAINYALFDLFLITSDAILFGEDVADFSGELRDDAEQQKELRGKGGVFLATKGLQRAFGNKRVFNTPLDEAGILSRAMGHAFQGRIALPEIQFLDYMSPAYQQLKDRIATLYQRSGGQENANVVIRASYGGYKQGAGSFWHSEANLGTFLNIPGLHVVCPSNAADAVGLMRTAIACGDPVLFLEAVALYNRNDWGGVNLRRRYPPLEEMIPFGKAEVYNPDNTDLAIISYGITLPLCLQAAAILREKGTSARVIDLRTLRPIDEEIVKQAAVECGRVLIVSEDRFFGGTGPTISALITSSDALVYLDAPVRVLTALDARVAYGPDGDNVCLPQVENIVAEAEQIVAF